MPTTKNSVFWLLSFGSLFNLILIHFGSYCCYCNFLLFAYRNILPAITKMWYNYLDACLIIIFLYCLIHVGCAQKEDNMQCIYYFYRFFSFLFFRLLLLYIQIQIHIYVYCCSICMVCKLNTTCYLIHRTAKIKKT